MKSQRKLQKGPFFFRLMLKRRNSASTQMCCVFLVLLGRLKESCSEKKSSILICVHDMEEAYFALFKKYGYEVLSHIEGEVQKKREENIKKENFYLAVIKKMQEYVERYDIKQIILASPAFWKEDLIKEVKDAELKQKIIPAACSSATKNGIEEVIKRPEVKQALREER